MSEGARVELLEDGAQIYAGQDPGTTVTGRPAGDHAYVLRVEGEPDQACTVRVEPPPLALAFGLFGLGAVVFLATLALIVRGDRRLRAGGRA